LVLPTFAGALKKWDGGRVPGGACPLPNYGGSGCHPWKMFENIVADPCNLVHFGGEVCKMYNFVFNLECERSISCPRHIGSGTEFAVFAI